MQRIKIISDKDTGWNDEKDQKLESQDYRNKFFLPLQATLKTFLFYASVKRKNFRTSQSRQ